MQLRCPLCKGFHSIDISDRDLPEIKRTEANFWKTKYFEMRLAVVEANKGIRRLKRKNKPYNRPKSRTVD